MNAVTKHVWGQSVASDYLWSLVCGYGSSAGGRMLVNLQAMIDDSRDANGTFVLGGYISSAERWDSFTTEWECLLPLATRGSSGRFRFKMAEMAQFPDRRESVPKFFEVIDRHVMASVSARFSLKDLEYVTRRILVPGKDVDWGFFANPYYFCFRILMDKFHAEMHQMDFLFGKDQKVDFFFDTQSESGRIQSSWDDYIQARSPVIRSRYGAHPVFRSEEDLIPLQAADFWAWWVRKWHKEGRPDKIMEWDFDWFQKNSDRKHLRIDIAFNQDDIMKVMVAILREHLGPDIPIIDLRRLDGFRGAK